MSVLKEGFEALKKDCPRISITMKLGHSEKGRKGVYGLGGLWRIVWCMEIGAIGVVKEIRKRYALAPFLHPYL